MHTCCIQACRQESSFNSQSSEQFQVLLLQRLEALSALENKAHI